MVLFGFDLADWLVCVLHCCFSFIRQGLTLLLKLALNSPDAQACNPPVSTRAGVTGMCHHTYSAPLYRFYMLVSPNLWSAFSFNSLFRTKSINCKVLCITFSSLVLRHSNKSSPGLKSDYLFLKRS